MRADWRYIAGRLTMRHPKQCEWADWRGSRAQRSRRPWAAPPRCGGMTARPPWPAAVSGRARAQQGAPVAAHPRVCGQRHCAHQAHAERAGRERHALRAVLHPRPLRRRRRGAPATVPTPTPTGLLGGLLSSPCKLCASHRHSADASGVTLTSCRTLPGAPPARAGAASPSAARPRVRPRTLGQGAVERSRACAGPRRGARGARWPR